VYMSMQVCENGSTCVHAYVSASVIVCFSECACLGVSVTYFACVTLCLVTKPMASARLIWWQDKLVYYMLV